MDEGSTFINFYNSLERQKKHRNVIYFFDRKDSYSLYGQDAKFVAQEYYHTLAAMKKIGKQEKQLNTISVTRTMFESMLIDLLLDKNYNLEVWENVSGAWRVTKKGSPGNIQDFEDTLTQSYGTTQQPIVVAAKLVERQNTLHVGIAYADGTKREFGSVEFMDNASLTTLESVLIQIGAKECLIEESGNTGKISQLESLLMKCDISISQRSRSEFNAGDIEQDMTTLVGDVKYNLRQLDEKLALACLSAVVKYLDLLADDTNLGMFTWSEFKISRYMRMDYAALKAMNVFPSQNESHATSDISKARASLFGLLNRCNTSMGSRLLYRWLKQPLVDVSEINGRLDIVQHFLEDTTLRTTLQMDLFKGVPDCFRLSKKFQRKKAKLEDCVRAYEFLLKLPQIITALDSSCTSYSVESSVKVIRERYADALRELEKNFNSFMAMVETTIDLSGVTSYKYYIAPQFDAELRDLKQQREELLAEMQKHFGKVALEFGAKSALFKMERNDTIGHHFRISRKDEKLIRGNKNFTILETRNNGVKFVTSKLKELSFAFECSLSKYEEKQSEIVEKVMDVAVTYANPLLMLGEIVSEMDVLLAFADIAFSSAMPYVRPSIFENTAEDGRIILKNCRHPCIELADDVDFIANDVYLRKGEVEFLVITGPNMGGKSTFIRQTAVSVLLAQIGSFVPCDHADISIQDQILCRMGAGDDLQRGISTFMAEMLETAAILNSATPRSLILIDELGRGTSTYDGFGLAWAISMQIARNIGCFSFFATHFHELTAIDVFVPTIKNFHVTVNATPTALTLLYKVKEGACDQSFGIHVAELAHFPDHVIRNARKKLEELESFKTERNGDENEGSASEGSSASAGLKRKLAIVDGVQKNGDGGGFEDFEAIRSLLHEFKTVPIDKMSPEEVKVKFNELKMKYKING